MKKSPVKKTIAKARKPRKKADSKLPKGVDADGVYRVKVPKSPLDDFFGRTAAQVKADTKRAKAAQESATFSFHEPIAPDADTQRMIDAMLERSNRDTKAQLEHVESLKGPRNGVNEAEVYSYTTFPVPIHDYLDYIKSTKNNLDSWSDLKNFIKTTEGFWKTMREQSCKIVLAAARKAHDDSYNISNFLRGEDATTNKYRDGRYFRKILGQYIDEIEREMADKPSLSKGLLELVSDYIEHERSVALSVEESICGSNNDDS